MSISLTNESKNSLSISNENKFAGTTWDEATYSWDEAAGTWDLPGLGISNETKNTLSITNETKN